MQSWEIGKNYNRKTQLIKKLYDVREMTWIGNPIMDLGLTCGEEVERTVAAILCCEEEKMTQRWEF